MELREYAKRLRRRWLLIIIPALIVLAVGLITYRPAPPVYNAGVRFIVGQPPADPAAPRDEERYYNWLTSEYIVNGLTDWVRGGEFANAVSAYAAEQGIAVPPAAIQGGLAADNTRSMLTLSLTYGDPAVLPVLMESAITVLTEQNLEALPQLGAEPARLTQLDQPVVTPIPPGIRSQLDLPLRLIIALFAGIGLALLVEYLDPTVRDSAEIQQMGLSVLGEIPKK